MFIPVTKVIRFDLLTFIRVTKVRLTQNLTGSRILTDNRSSRFSVRLQINNNIII